MSASEIIIGVLMIIVSLIIIFVILLQEGRQANLSGVISGGADTFLSKNKARSVDAFLAKWTKVIAIGFFVLALAANVIMLIGK